VTDLNFSKLLYSKFGDFGDGIYPNELEIKDTTGTARSASYLDLCLNIDSDGQLRTKLRQKRWFQFSHCELSIYMYQHSSNNCIRRLYL